MFQISFQLEDPGDGSDNEASGPEETDSDPDEPSDDDNNSDHGGDPDEPHDDGNPGDPSDSDESDDDNPNFDLDNTELNILCRQFVACSKREVLAIIAAMAVRDDIKYVEMIRMMKTIKIILGRSYLPGNLHVLWKAFRRNQYGIKELSYCKKCQRSFGRRDRLPEEGNIICEGCEHNSPVSDVGLFVDLKLKPQSRHFLEEDGTWDTI